MTESVFVKENSMQEADCYKNFDNVFHYLTIFFSVGFTCNCALTVDVVFCCTRCTCIYTVYGYIVDSSISFLLII